MIVSKELTRSALEPRAPAWQAHVSRDKSVSKTQGDTYTDQPTVYCAQWHSTALDTGAPLSARVPFGHRLRAQTLCRHVAGATLCRDRDAYDALKKHGR